MPLDVVNILIAIVMLTVVFYAVKAYDQALPIWITVTGGVLTVVCVAPFGTHVGEGLARGNLSTYSEFWNGYEKAAKSSVTKCGRDGSCRHTYQCDPYTVTETHSTTDSKGNTSYYTTEETRYHSCPEATEEIHYWIETTLGDFNVDSAAFSANPIAWRSNHGLSGNVQRGEPVLWGQARDRLARNDPGPVTKRMNYKNYILASQNSLLKKYSGAIETYQKQLPAPAGPIRDLYQADKVSFIGYQPRDPGEWQFSLARLNAAAGMDLQGDVHMVIVDSAMNPEEYSGALAAYWQSKAFGREALSKNGIGVVIGAKDEKVVWARAFTGMPQGNEGLMQDIQSGLVGANLNPDEVIGKPVGKIGDSVEITHGTGHLESVLWGPNKFLRVQMGSDDGPGYEYLKAELEPTTGQKVLITGSIVVINGIIWTLLVALNYGLKETQW